MIPIRCMDYSNDCNKALSAFLLLFALVYHCINISAEEVAAGSKVRFAHERMKLYQINCHLGAVWNVLAPPNPN